MYKSKKRKRVTFDLETKKYNNNYDITVDFIKQCEDNFKSDPSNIIARNAIVSVGSTLATTNSVELNKVNHIFMNTVKKKDLRATNQGYTGRCWLYGGLNTFRHHLIHALNLDNFEFSEVYLFFWDKLERSNSFLSWFIDNEDQKPGDRHFDYMLQDFMSDGGYWNFFANLVEKYGMIPKSAMKETYQSDYSEDMNKVIEERLRYCVNTIYKRGHRMSQDQKLDLKNEVIEQIYNILVKFLGEPPKTFSWAFTDEEDNPTVIQQLDAKSFMNMVIPHVDMKKFVVLCDSPTEHLKYNQMYEIKDCTNIYGGMGNKFLNIHIDEMTKYAAKSILSGMPVWFAADVSQSFNPYYSTLDDKLVDDKHIFGETKNFSKGDRITLRNVQGNHAMCLTGVNFDKKGIPTEWQVENSWGYYDHETRGEDGWLTMSHSWFKKYVIEIVIHKNYLTRTVQKHTTKEPIILEPWDSMAPAIRVGCVDAPRIVERIRRMKRVR